MLKCPECGYDATKELSSREKEVASLLGAGQSMTDIAKTLHISIKSASTYGVRARQKLGLNSPLQLALHAQAAGWSKP